MRLAASLHIDRRLSHRRASDCVTVTYCIWLELRMRTIARDKRRGGDQPLLIGDDDGAQKLQAHIHRKQDANRAKPDPYPFGGTPSHPSALTGRSPVAQRKSAPVIVCSPRRISAWSKIMEPTPCHSR